MLVLGSAMVTLDSKTGTGGATVGHGLGVAPGLNHCEITRIDVALALVCAS
jgi:hypothetical protein